MSLKVIQFLLLITIIYHVQCDELGDLRKKVDNQLELMKSKLNLMEFELAQMNKTIESKITINVETGCGEDWFPYSDTKCYKVLGKKGSELEAKGNCSQLESSSTLITIHSKDEQNFLSNRLKVYNNISVNVWIGLEFFDNAFHWMDTNELKYENWGENALKKSDNRCVQMSLADSELGKWTDDLCEKKYQIICQKKQMSKKVINEQIYNLTKVVEKLVDENKSQQDKIDLLIPLDFIYTHLPNQSSPQQLWPYMEWSDITKNYSGLFFRAEGNGSEPFGKIQQANVYTTGGEVRPKNTAIRIWKRIQ